MNLLKEIYDEIVVNGNEGSFCVTSCVTSGGWTYMFTQAIYGESRLVYVTDYGRSLERKNTFAIFAVVIGERMVVMNDNLFFLRNGYEPIPNVTAFVEFMQDVEKDVNGVDIPLYVGEIKADINTLSDDEKSVCKKVARGRLLGGKFAYTYPYFKLSEDNAFDLLLGKTTIEELEDDFFKNKRYDLENIRTCEVYTKKLIESGSVAVEDWKKKLVNALRESDAKTVNVIFSKDGKIVDAKMVRDSLISGIVNGDGLYYSALFISYKECQRVLAELRSDRCSINEIEKIVYKGKVLYEKEETV